MAEYRDANMAVQNRLTPYQTWYTTAFEIGFAAVLLAGSALYATGTLDGMGLLLFMVIMLGFYEPIPLLDYTLARRRYLASMGRLTEVLGETPLAEPAREQELHPAGFDVELNQVGFSYYKHTPGQQEPARTLQGINLTIPERSMTALVGPSGGGKTTMLNLISRFWDVQEGSIRIGGIDVRQMRADTLMKHISVVFQDVYLFKDTILNTLVGEGGGTLSGGEKQRISIARAILKNAPIILLDEATASIDPENEWEIQAALRALSANKTLIVVAHRLSTIQHADQIVVIDQGSIVQQGTHDELYAAQGLYRSFWEERSRVQNWTFNDRGVAEPMSAGTAK